MGTNKRFRFFPVIIICLAFVLLSVALLGQQFYGRFTQKEQLVSLLPAEDLREIRREQAEKTKSQPVPPKSRSKTKQKGR